MELGTKFLQTWHSCGFLIPGHSGNPLPPSQKKKKNPEKASMQQANTQANASVEAATKSLLVQECTLYGGTPPAVRGTSPLSREGTPTVCDPILNNTTTRNFRRHRSQTVDVPSRERGDVPWTAERWISGIRRMEEGNAIQKE